MGESAEIKQLLDDLAEARKCSGCQYREPPPAKPKWLAVVGSLVAIAIGMGGVYWGVGSTLFLTREAAAAKAETHDRSGHPEMRQHLETLDAAIDKLDGKIDKVLDKLSNRR